MRRKINSLFYKAGAVIVFVGFVLCLKAAGLSDNDGEMSEIFRTATAGVITALTGLFIHRWRV